MSGVALIRTEYVSEVNPCVTMPMGIYQLTSVLEKQGVEVCAALDLLIVKPRDIRRELERIVARQPDVIGLSSASHQLRFAHRVADFFKKRLPHVPVVVGGPFVSANHENAMDCPSVDFGVHGEGEDALPALVRALAAGEDYRSIPRLAYREDGGLHLNPSAPISYSLDELPFIAWDRIDFARYGKFMSMCFQRSPYAAVFTSRGCPFQCIFCHNHFGRQYRFRSPDRVLEEMHLLYDRDGIRRFEINEDLFNWDYDRATEILTRVRDELPAASVGFGSGIRADLLDEPFVKLLAEVNCYFLAIPVETAVPRLQKLIRKNLDLKKAERAANLARRYGLHTWAFFLLGFPTETEEEMETTVAYAEQLDVDFVSIQSVSPYEGTELRAMLGELPADLELGNPHADYRRGDFSLEHINDLKTLVMRNRLKRRANWYFVKNLLLWKLWWLGPKNALAHLAITVWESLFHRGVMIDRFERNRRRLAREVFSSLD
ncbi:MAG: cobalamin-dependent protein [Candidatus Lernaella stagnicola]|nr:cobalamin-dependent protein [Candidatus Lernaella stagnicola]